MFRDPPPKIYGSRTLALPYFIIGDAAFPRGRHIVRPYPERSNFTPPKKVFNLRLSHARQCIERAFGILVQRFRIFRKPIQLKLENVERVVRAAVCLHNWFHADEDMEEFSEANDPPTMLTEEDPASEMNRVNVPGVDVAAELSNFFMNEGAQRFQWRAL